MLGWIMPLPREPTKTRGELARERAAKGEQLTEAGYLKSVHIRRALLTVPREDFIPYL
jgi:hypothetical protein